MTQKLDRSGKRSQRGLFQQIVRAVHGKLHRAAFTHRAVLFCKRAHGDSLYLENFVFRYGATSSICSGDQLNRLVD